MSKAIQIIETYTEVDAHTGKDSKWEVGTCSFASANFTVWKDGNEIGHYDTIDTARKAVPVRMR
ncbi:MAG: hypothetical protein V3S55_15545 [Nitrospiraceae bacterium]